MNGAQTAVPTRVHLEQAADWWTRIHDADAPAEEVSAWLEWLEGDARHREAFERIQELSLRLTAGGESSQLHNAGRRSGWTGRLAASVVFAVMVAGAAGFWWLNSPTRPATRFSTPVAAFEQKSLSDGSTVSLGGATVVEAAYTPHSRDLQLKEGEAYFQVHRDASQRPFVVDAGPVSIRALGTAFNVRKTQERITVTVTEGKVQVARSSLGTWPRRDSAGGGVEISAGEQAVYDSATDRFRVVIADTARALGWREQRLEFTDEPLDSVIENINRYSPRRIEVRGEGLHRHSYTGTFDPDTLDAWLIAIGRAFPVRVGAEGERITVESIH